MEKSLSILYFFSSIFRISKLKKVRFTRFINLMQTSKNSIDFVSYQNANHNHISRGWHGTHLQKRMQRWLQVWWHEFDEKTSACDETQYIRCDHQHCEYYVSEFCPFTNCFICRTDAKHGQNTFICCKRN